MLHQGRQHRTIEEQAPERPDVHTTGAGRPAGKAGPDDSGVNPTPAVTGDSPNLQGP